MCKARCEFIQYMTNKPDKLGLKFWVAVDFEAKYFFNSFMCLENNISRNESPQFGEHVVMKLIDPGFFCKERNVTKYMSVMSQKLANPLCAKGTDIVHTIRLNGTEISSICKDTTKHASHYKYIKSNKLPETVNVYNCTKYGVNILHQMC